MNNQQSEQGLIQKCSNCGFINKYTKEELEAVFPFSRETLICRNCLRTLSVNSWVVGE